MGVASQTMRIDTSTFKGRQQFAHFLMSEDNFAALFLLLKLSFFSGLKETNWEIQAVPPGACISVKFVNVSSVICNLKLYFMPEVCL